MAKFILSVGDQTFRVLATEARKRDVTVQQLLRAVILPEWVKDNVALNAQELPRREIAPHLMRYSAYRHQQEPVIIAGAGSTRR